MNAQLILEDGTVFRGRSLGAERSVSGEVVFNTGMVGYTEALTDPSYRGQIMTLTFPLVGNYGVPREFESPRIQASALVVSELATEYSHSAAERSLPQWLKDEGIPCISGIDTRALTKRLRTRGCMLGKVVVNNQETEFFDPNQKNLVAEVSTSHREAFLGSGCGVGRSQQQNGACAGGDDESQAESHRREHQCPTVLLILWAVQHGSATHRSG